MNNLKDPEKETPGKDRAPEEEKKTERGTKDTDTANREQDVLLAWHALGQRALSYSRKRRPGRRR